MKSTVETLSPTRVRLAIEVPFAELEPSLRKAYREISAQVNIPGFRPGKVPAAVIDQRIGRGAVLEQAVDDAIERQYLAAVQEHNIQILGRATVDNREFGDGQPLKFTAEVDVRPVFTLPAIDRIEVTVDPVEVTEEEVDTQVEGLRQRFATLKGVERAAQVGDYVQIDLAATVDGRDVPGGSATNLSHEVGSNQLLPGLDEVLVGMTAGEAQSFTTQLVGGDYAGKDADVSVTVRTVRERELPALDDDFAQLASEFDTIEELRADLHTRLGKVKRVEQLYQARDRSLEAIVKATDVPAPEGVVREEVEHRKEAMVEQLERVGLSLEDYLGSEGKTEQDVDADLTAAATEGVKIQLVLDALANAEQIQISEEELLHEIMHRAQRANMTPQQYYDQLVRAGAERAVAADVRRNKTLARVMEQVTIKDSTGAPISLSDLRGAADDDQDDHEGHEGHDHA